MSLDQARGFVKSQTLTRDAFLGGRIHVLQPEKGFRAGMDSVLLGAGISLKSGDLLDLGSGAGTAAMVAMAHEEAVHALLTEKDPDFAGLAERNLGENNFAGRARVVAIDVTAPGRQRVSAGLKADHFATIIANPPFFDEGSGTPPPAKGRAGARHMEAGELEKWVKTAASAAAPDGEIIFIYRAGGLEPLLSAFSARFGAITLLPIVPRQGEDATRILIRGIKGSRAPLTLKSPLVLHGGEGRAFRPEIDAIFRGQARLHW